MALVKKCKHPRRQWSRCRCAYYWSGYVNGIREYRNLGPDREAALIKDAEFNLAHARGQTVRRTPVNVSVAAVAERWIDQCRARKLRPQSIRAYRTSANAVVRYFSEGFDVRTIDADEMVAFEADAFAKRRGTGGQHLMQGLRGILKQAHREGIIAALPTPPIERRKVVSNPDVKMSESETIATVEALSPIDPWRALGDFVVLTGLRISEALALRWVDFDEKAGTLTIRHSAEQRGKVDAPTKTEKSERLLRLEAEVVEILKAQRRADERIFPRRYSAAHAAIRRAMNRAGTYKRDRGWHSLRHTNTALRDRAGQSIRQSAAELGHGANFVMTHSYGWASEAGDPAPVSKVRQPRPPRPSET